MEYINSYKEIRDIVEETYHVIYPHKRQRTSVSVISRQKMYDRFGTTAVGILDRNIFFRRIYVQEGDKFRVLYRIAHELGHAQKPNYNHVSVFLEEIKAFLFQLAWNDAVVAHNIGGYGEIVSEMQEQKRAEDITGYEHVSPFYVQSFRCAQRIFNDNRRDLSKAYSDMKKYSSSLELFDMFLLNKESCHNA